MNLLIREFPTSLAEQIEQLADKEHRKRNDQILYWLEGIAAGRIQMVLVDPSAVSGSAKDSQPQAA